MSRLKYDTAKYQYLTNNDMQLILDRFHKFWNLSCIHINKVFSNELDKNKGNWCKQVS